MQYLLSFRRKNYGNSPPLSLNKVSNNISSFDVKVSPIPSVSFKSCTGSAPENSLKQNNNNNIAIQKEQNNSPESDGVACSYKNCEKLNECSYFKENSSFPSPENDSNELRNNMKENDEIKYNNIYNLINDKQLNQGVSLKTAAHHIIPGNECYSKVQKLLNLGNFFGFNINIAENGILLPTVSSYEGKDDLKNEIAFEAMNITGREWHLGMHSLKYSIQLDLAKAINKEIIPYDEKVCALLYKLSAEYERRYKRDGICPNDNKKDEALRFEKKMKNIAEKVRNKLKSFSNDPSDAEYYVSYLAICYAFEEAIKEYEEKTGKHIS